MTKEIEPLRLGIPKGSLEKMTVDLFARAGWGIQTSSRSYFPSIDDPAIRCSLMRPQEMSRYIENGTLDAGITGQDWITENQSDVEKVADLVYSKVSLQGTRWVLVVKEDSAITKPEDLAGKRISTELIGVTKRFFADRKIEVDVEFSWGATEAKVAEGLVDAIVDVTETGSTLRANNLRIVSELIPSNPVLVANKKAWADPGRRRKIEQIAMLLRGALEAQGKVGVKLNVKDSGLEEVIALLPSLTAPTVASLAQTEKLHGDKWYAVETVIAEATVRDLIPQLLDAGATGILEYPINKLI
ncbi:MAG: ATP phosphoribosyltransferase [Candidatus Binatia bacterium]|nr:ATP phosphoribosyltransferase [Candidatus Binatia bacterium]MDG1957726.1 ATP phosphoribosyltransferase [Candidatus Binatia bacterium]MDG2010871.1 ATP phosphoribosyltransferase [Candidatus Binatia bacterium]